jgi:hypothetical protein
MKDQQASGPGDTAVLTMKRIVMVSPPGEPATRLAHQRI